MSDTPALSDDIQDLLDECKIQLQQESRPKATPTPDQQKAIDDFFAFLLSDEKEYHLTGGAGVGKTFVLDLIMTDGMERYEEACSVLGIKQSIWNIALTATTNKAAEVLSRSTGLPATTIHSHLGLRVTEDYSTGETKIRPGPNHMIRKDELIIIDEASMIDSQLYDMIMKSTYNCKFLYVGDHCQMAPVFEKISRIYNNKAFFSYLVQPMRNASQPALMAICDQFRKTVETGVFQPITPVPGVIDVVNGPTMQSLVDATFLDHNPSARILCYRNQQVKDYNQYIRTLRGLPDYFEEDEYLVCANAYNRGDVRLSIEEEVQVLKNPRKEHIHKVRDVEFSTYELLVQPLKGGRPFTVYIPSEPEHFNALIKHFSKHKIWTAYFYLKQQFPDLRPKDASTVYKAQGSTYDTVFVDLDDISRCTQADQVARMLYVAVSRPRNRLILYGKLKPAYSGG